MENKRRASPKPPNPLLDVGAGLTTKSAGLDQHPAGPPKHGTAGQAERAFTAASTFFSGLLAISASQFLGAPLKAIDPKFYESYMAFTKQSFGVLITTMTQWWSPTVVKVSGDTSLPKQLFHRKDGTLECRFPKRIVMMANHQLYTDWLYLWWVAYTNNMHGHIYIILKESLKNIPIVGWGAQFYNFIFLSRNWERDQQQFGAALDQLNKPTDPMWLLIFPEGTNLAKGTRENSKAWAEKTGVEDMKHQLLPRSRGTQFTLQRLSETTEWLYDVTIGYEGIPPGQFGQDIFTLRSSMFEGRPPKSVNMHFRRFKISSIPIHDDKAFDSWLRNRWREKDYLLEHFSRFNCFPNDINWMTNIKQKQSGKSDLIKQPARSIETQIKSNSLEEFLSIFAPLTSILTVLMLFYGGGNSADMVQMLGDLPGKGKELLSLTQDITGEPDLSGSTLPKAGESRNKASLSEIDKLTPAVAQKDIIENYLKSVRPMAAKEIELPKDALRKANLPSRTAKPKAAASQPAQKAKSIPVNKPPGRAVSMASAPILKKNTHAQANAPNKKSETPNLQQMPSRLNRTIYPGSSVSRAGTVVNAARPQVQRKPEPMRRTPNSASKPSAQNQTKKATSHKPNALITASPAKKRQGDATPVTIDAAILEKMKGAKSAQLPAGKQVSVDPKVQSRLKIVKSGQKG